ncbi:MAG: hypothetical protein A2259_01010 [Candidatus Moranbacteria bacterium RIFOXYA2_FULL_43_15]|nr:MAG: hypothetical protein A2259_01010 [Candidatus Moranbacteria bacterium RIFOXYA2_FULL_43_15]
MKKVFKRVSQAYETVKKSVQEKRREFKKNFERIKSEMLQEVMKAESPEDLIALGKKFQEQGEVLKAEQDGIKQKEIEEERSEADKDLMGENKNFDEMKIARNAEAEQLAVKERVAHEKHVREIEADDQVRINEIRAKLEEGNERYVKPPLGERPDFDKMEKDRMKKLLGLNHYELDNFPEIINTLESATMKINAVRSEIGLSAKEFNSEKIRLIKNENGEFDQYSRKAGFYDNESGNVIYGFEEGRFFMDLTYKVEILYNLIHEMIHQSMAGGVNEEFHLLDEGFVDTIAMEIMHDEMPKLLNKREIDSNKLAIKKFLKDYPVTKTEEGEFIEAEEQDILFVEEKKDPVASTRIVNRRVIGKIKQSNPELYKKLLKAAFEKDSQEISDLIVENYSGKMLENLKYMKVEDILNEFDYK